MRSVYRNPTLPNVERDGMNKTYQTDDKCIVLSTQHPQFLICEVCPTQIREQNNKPLDSIQTEWKWEYGARKEQCVKVVGKSVRNQDIVGDKGSSIDR